MPRDINRVYNNINTNILEWIFYENMTTIVLKW